MHERLHAIVSGRVQGVMFRDFALRHAHTLSLTGFVKNLPDGTVEVIAEGSRERLDALLEKLNKGPMVSDVTNVTPLYSAATDEFESFTIATESNSVIG